jgi:hypothetical protein
MPAPADIDERMWKAMVEAAGLLLDRWGPALAATGWRTDELFGIHADRPLARHEHAGLVRYLLRLDAVEVTAEAAMLASATGARQAYRRRSDPPGSEWVLLWDLKPASANAQRDTGTAQRSADLDDPVPSTGLEHRRCLA